MRRLSSCLLLLLLLVIGCAEKKPANVLAPEKMRVVMWDLMQADELTSYYASTDSATASETRRLNYYAAICRTHNVSKGLIDTSLRYYRSHPAEMQTILDSLQAQSERPEMRDTTVKRPQRKLIKP